VAYTSVEMRVVVTINLRKSVVPLKDFEREPLIVKRQENGRESLRTV